MNNIMSGTKYRASPEGVSLMDETNNLAAQCDKTEHNDFHKPVSGTI